MSGSEGLVQLARGRGGGRGEGLVTSPPGAAGGSCLFVDTAPMGSLGSCWITCLSNCLTTSRLLLKGPFSKKVCPIQAAHRRPPLPSPFPNPLRETHKHILKEGPGRKELQR